MRREIIKVIHCDQLYELFEKLGIKEEIEKGELRCGRCEEVITTDNFLCAYPRHGNIVICCTSRECRECLIDPFFEK